MQYENEKRETCCCCCGLDKGVRWISFVVFLQAALNFTVFYHEFVEGPPICYSDLIIAILLLILF